MRKNVLGVKLGSQWTVAYGKGIIPDDFESIGPRKELTCICPVPTHLLEKKSEYIFSREADLYHGCVYPLEYGMPRGDNPVEIARSVKLLSRYVDWLLQGVEEDTGIVFCLPMMGFKEGLERLKNTINKQSTGILGKRYIMEAWAAALATVGVDESLRSQVISLNFGSSTLEVVLYVGKKLIAQNVYPFGGWRIDRVMQNVISQAHRGIDVTQRQAREVKEQYSYKDGNPIDGMFTKEGRRIEVQITKDEMNPILEDFAEQTAKHIAQHFLPTAAERSQRAVTAIQTEGVGYVCICGGLSNMPGFPDLMKDKLVEVGALNPDLKISYPTDPDGVAAPAYGAYMLADMFEEQREKKGTETW